MGKMFLNAIDVHPKWMKIENSVTTQASNECLQLMFAQFGLPKVLVTDNGMCFHQQ